MHGPKFAWDEPGSSSAKVLRYDQVHRVASGPSCFSRPPYQAMVDDEGQLPSDPWKRVPEFRRPRWDGLAYIAYAEEADIEATLGQEKFAKRIIVDEQTAFRMVTREITREYILIPSKRHRDAISLVKIHMRRPELSREEFQHRLLHEHANLVLAQTATHELVRRYAQLHNIGSTQKDPEGSKIDAVSVLAFASMNDVEDYLVSDDHAAIEASESALKEQMGGIYAAELAKRGIIALAIDYRNYGQSSGARRQYEDPEGKAADLSAALKFLKARADVAGTGLLGVCTSGGTVLDAAAADSSVGAVATVAGMFTEPSLQLMMRGAEGVQAKKDEGRAAKNLYAQSAVIKTVKAYDESDQTAANVAPLPYYFDTSRGAVPAWRNEFAVMSYEAMLDFDPVSKASQVTAPTLIIHSGDSAFPDQAKKAHALLAGSKELYWPEGTHLDFYDQAPQVRDAADHAAEHFRAHLS